jgi:hypothetical protein
MFVCLVSGKSDLIKSFSSSEDPSVYKISRSYVDWRKFGVYFRSLNVRHVGMAKAARLKVLALSHLQYHNLCTEFHGNLSTGSIVDSGDRNTDRMIHSLAYIFPVGRKVG